MFDAISIVLIISRGILLNLYLTLLIALLCSKGGEANYHDENGREVGPGNGDLNH